MNRMMQAVPHPKKQTMTNRQQLTSQIQHGNGSSSGFLGILSLFNEQLMGYIYG